MCPQWVPTFPLHRPCAPSLLAHGRPSPQRTGPLIPTALGPAPTEPNFLTDVLHQFRTTLPADTAAIVCDVTHISRVWTAFNQPSGFDKIVRWLRIDRTATIISPVGLRIRIVPDPPSQQSSSRCDETVNPDHQITPRWLSVAGAGPAPLSIEEAAPGDTAHLHGDHPGRRAEVLHWWRFLSLSIPGSAFLKTRGPPPQNRSINLPSSGSQPAPFPPQPTLNVFCIFFQPGFFVRWKLPPPPL